MRLGEGGCATIVNGLGGAVEMSDSPSERRRYPRRKKSLLTSYVVFEEGKQQTPVRIGVTRDVSRAGARMELFDEVRPRSRVELVVEVGDRAVPVSGTVVHTHPKNGKHPEAGVAFDTLQDEQALDLQ